jgi:NADPH:quinone reductase-like Zn-dependent oxidoreductase
MKTVQFDRYGGPEVLHSVEVADPVPGPEDVLIAVKATTVNHLDLFQRDGSRPVGNLPFTPGLEAVGAVLKDSQGYHAGDRVMTTWATTARGGGGYANMLAVAAANLVRIPDGVSYEAAAATGLTSSTAWGALFDVGQLQAGERILIWSGSSGVGSISIQIAKHFGCQVLTTTTSEAKAADLRRLGADIVINPKTQDVAKVAQEAGGVHLVIELVSTTLQTSIDACARGGRVVLIGNLGGQMATVDTQSWRLKLVNVLGGGVRHTSTANERRILELVAQHAIAPIIARTMPVEQAAEAHRLLAEGGLVGKIVLVHE